VAEGKSPILKWFAGALGIGLGLGLVVLGAVAYSMLPKGWDRKATTASFDSVDFNTTPSPAVYYTYTLTNNTSKDFSTKLLDQSHLPENLRAATLRGRIYDDIASVPKPTPTPALNFGDISFYTGDLNADESYARLAKGEPLFIPAKKSVQIRLRWEIPATELAKYGSVNILNTSLFGFVVYDDATKYEIDFDKPPLLQGKQTELDVVATNDLIAPDHKGKPWEVYASCGEAERLVPLCKQKNFQPGGFFAKYGGFSVPLPEMRLPPKGYLLEPDQPSCDIVYQWKNYCDKLQ
jgi:hypothetical protein